MNYIKIEDYFGIPKINSQTTEDAEFEIISSTIKDDRQVNSEYECGRSNDWAELLKRLFSERYA